MYTIYFNYTQGNNTWEDFVAYNKKPTELGMTPWDITVTGWEKN